MNASNGTDSLVHVTVDRLRVVLFAGPQFPKILENFTALSGRAVLPPYWAGPVVVAARQTNLISFSPDEGNQYLFLPD